MMDKKTDNSAQEIQTDLSEIERDLTLRGFLWNSLEEWTHLVEEWTATSFDSINVESLQKNVNKFTQTVYMLEKGETFCSKLAGSEMDVDLKSIREDIQVVCSACKLQKS